MITPMQKVTVLCLDTGRDSALQSLRKLSVLHLTFDRQAEHEDIEAARRHLDYVRRASDIVPRLPQQPRSGLSPSEIVDQLSRLIQQRRENHEDLARLRQELKRIQPFGSFSPQSVAALAERGVFIRLFQASPRSFPALPDEALYLETLRTRAAVFFAVVTRDEKPEIAAQEIHSPATSLADIERRITELEAAQASITVQVAQFGGDYPALAQLRGEAEDALQMAAVRVGMSSATARIAYLQGFCPTTDVDRLRQACLLYTSRCV